MNDNNDRKQRYISQVYTALQHYAETIGPFSVVAGDFNWNATWDRAPDSPLYGDFAATVRLLTIQGLGSAYHLVHHCDFGNEPHATFYMHRRKDRPYHIDYVFVPRKTFPKLVEFQLGVYDEWAGASDHMPIILEISL